MGDVPVRLDRKPCTSSTASARGSRSKPIEAREDATPSPASTASLIASLQPSSIRMAGSRSVCEDPLRDARVLEPGSRTMSGSCANRANGVDRAPASGWSLRASTMNGFGRTGCITMPPRPGKRQEVEIVRAVRQPREQRLARSTCTDG
jgi:hypothetical protein